LSTIYINSDTDSNTEMSGKLLSYRARKACREEYNDLRAQLHKLKDTEWQRAGIVMMRIAELLGHRYGPMGGQIEPRACKFCRYYGHTKQWCPKRNDAGVLSTASPPLDSSKRRGLSPNANQPCPRSSSRMPTSHAELQSACPARRRRLPSRPCRDSP